jgi:hypothetical protein
VRMWKVDRVMNPVKAAFVNFKRSRYFFEGAALMLQSPVCGYAPMHDGPPNDEQRAPTESAALLEQPAERVLQAISLPLLGGPGGHREGPDGGTNDMSARELEMLSGGDVALEPPASPSVS